MKKYELKDPFTPIMVNHFERTYISYGYFVFPPPNYLVGRYDQYIWHVKKMVVLSHDLNMFSCIFIILHNFKY